MQILAHRGFWSSPEEKNTMDAFARAFEHGFGVETDIRDSMGQLLISHDLPDGRGVPLEDFFELYNSYEKKSTLALNIKADGLQKTLLEQISNFEIEQYFVFDMSIPEAVKYIHSGFKAFSRWSEYEPLQDDILKMSSGVWIDSFKSDWWSSEHVENLIARGKDVAVVSPELHGRSEYLASWAKLKNIHSKKIMLCTDFPTEAKEFFDV